MSTQRKCSYGKVYKAIKVFYVRISRVWSGSHILYMVAN